MQVYDSVLDLIGNTPIVRINHFDTGHCTLYIKLESQNPGGSVKDRIGLKMIEDAEKAGLISPGATLVEGTAGNTGLGLALVAAQKGYHLVLVIPDKMSREKIFNLKAMGAEVVLTRSDVAKGHPEYYQDLAQSMANEIEGAFFINQFGNPSNPKAHEEVTGPEIWEQMGQDLDAIVLGVGSSGTATGLSHYFEQVAPDLELILADPVGSILAEYVNDGVLSDKRSSWLVEGIGEDFLPTISDFTRISKAYAISDKESMLTGRELLSKEGILAGPSTGTMLAAALKYCREQTQPKKVLTLAADTGNRYLSKMYNDFWMRDQGFVETERYGNLRDLIARPFESNDTITVGPDEPLANAYSRMKLYDVSQLPVIQKRKIVGFIDESDLLLAVAHSSETFSQPVSTAMVTELVSVDVNDSVDELIPVFHKDHIAIVKDGEQFLGLITRVDLLNYLRRKADC